MDILKVELVRCRVDCELKKKDKGMYVGLAKGLVGNDGIESIFYLEMDEEKYAYISGYDLESTLFDISGVMQARKNKNDVPFIYYKVMNLIKSEDKKVSKEEIAPIVEGNVEKEIEDKSDEKKKKKKKGENKVITVNEVVESLGLEPIIMSADKIKLTEKEHLKKAIVDLSRNLNLVIIRPLEESDGEYSLVLGYSALIKAKLLNTPVTAYIVNKTREEVVDYIKDFRNKKLNEESEI